ncbi:MAG: ROK family glucokinase [Lachnospiraceae bacterium]|nr:ROK family glucokinase [Lachnospiraceae bacterium]
MKYAVGVDIGGTTVKIGIFEENSKILDKWEIPTVKTNAGKQIITDVSNSVKSKLSEHGISMSDVLGLGVGAPGAVDENGFMCGGAVNLGWEPFNLREAFEKELGGITVKAANDANVAAFGEMWQGGGRGHSDMVAVTLGTGVGGGIIVNGKILAGATGAGGEIGHIHLEDDEPDTCGCGGHGCLEQYASATGIVRLAKRRLAGDDMPSVLRDGEVSAKTVFDAVKAGDKLAIEVAEKFGYYCGKGLAAVANVVNPQVFVIGGGVSKAGDILIKYIEPSFLKYAFPPCRGAKFAMAELGNDAGIVGAAGMIINN